MQQAQSRIQRLPFERALLERELQRLGPRLRVAFTVQRAERHHAEDDEDPETAIRRELKEELGLEPRNLTWLGEKILNEDIFGVNARAVVFRVQDLVRENLQLQEGRGIVTLGDGDPAVKMTAFCTWAINTYAD